MTGWFLWGWVMLSHPYLGLVGVWSLADAVCVMAGGQNRVNQRRQALCRSAECRVDVTRLKSRTNWGHRADLSALSSGSKPGSFCCQDLRSGLCWWIKGTHKLCFLAWLSSCLSARSPLCAIWTHPNLQCHEAKGLIVNLNSPHCLGSI